MPPPPPPSPACCPLRDAIPCEVAIHLQLPLEKMPRRGWPQALPLLGGGKGRRRCFGTPTGQPLGFLGVHRGSHSAESSADLASSREADALSTHSRCSALTCLGTRKQFQFIPVQVNLKRKPQTHILLHPGSNSPQLWEREQPRVVSFIRAAGKGRHEVQLSTGWQAQHCMSLSLLTRDGKGEGTPGSEPRALPAPCFLDRSWDRLMGPHE